MRRPISKVTYNLPVSMQTGPFYCPPHARMIPYTDLPWDAITACELPGSPHWDHIYPIKRIPKGTACYADGIEEAAGSMPAYVRRVRKEAEQ